MASEASGRGQGKLIDMTGQTFGRLRVVGQADASGGSQARWRCVCDCGAEAVARGDSLRSGHTTSCGCERARHGRLTSDRNIRHGATGTPLYIVWFGMVARCERPASRSYCNYGGRGISVAPEWRNDATAFIAWATANGWRRGLQIDRIDNNGHYEPSNCRFVTASENIRNRPPNGVPRPSVEALR